MSRGPTPRIPASADASSGELAGANLLPAQPRPGTRTGKRRARRQVPGAAAVSEPTHPRAQCPSLSLLDRLHRHRPSKD